MGNLKATNRLKIEERIDCDTSRLYNSLDDAIKYLQHIKSIYPTASLDEHWTGYEDMEMTFVFYRDETDDEMLARLEKIKRDEERAAEEREKAALREQRYKQYASLKKEFG